jgi:hypothetical protein
MDPLTRGFLFPVGIFPLSGNSNKHKRTVARYCTYLHTRNKGHDTADGEGIGQQQLCDRSASLLTISWRGNLFDSGQQSLLLLLGGIGLEGSRSGARTDVRTRLHLLRFGCTGT